MAWLYVPGQVASNSDSPLRSEHVTERSPTLSEKPRQLRYWQRIWNAGGWIRLLSGMTLKPSLAQSLVRSWVKSTCSRRVSPASRSRSQANSQGPTTNAGSGLILNDWFARYDLADCSWKTSQASFMEELSTFSEDWPRSGTMRNGLLYERPTLVHRTAGSGSSSWPTARVSMAHGASQAELDQGNPNRRIETEAENWHTPDTAPEAPNKGSNMTRGEGLKPPGLGNQAQSMMWATPTSRDYKDGSDPSENVETNALLGRQAPRWNGPQAPRTPMPGPQSSENDQISHRRLNPKFVEWLMGLPEGWLELTAFASSETE